jgi:cob(I)alamin adenosyltransferase
MKKPSKSNILISKVRTGKGDDGATLLAGKRWRKGHPLVLYSASLDEAQARTVAVVDGDLYRPRTLVQELLFRLGSAVGGIRPQVQETPITELLTKMEREIEALTAGLKPLESFIRTIEENQQMMSLRCALREAECRAVAAWDRLVLEEPNTTPNLQNALALSAKALNVASDWAFAHAWVFSCPTGDGKVLAGGIWTPMEDAEILNLNPIQAKEGNDEPA